MEGEGGTDGAWEQLSSNWLQSGDLEKLSPTLEPKARGQSPWE